MWNWGKNGNFQCTDVQCTEFAGLLHQSGNTEGAGFEPVAFINFQMGTALFYCKSRVFFRPALGLHGLPLGKLLSPGALLPGPTHHHLQGSNPNPPSAGNMRVLLVPGIAKMP